MQIKVKTLTGKEIEFDIEPTVNPKPLNPKPSIEFDIEPTVNSPPTNQTRKNTY